MSRFFRLFPTVLLLPILLASDGLVPCGAAVGLPGTAPLQESQASIEQAQNSLAEGRYEEAEIAFRRLLLSDSSSIPALLGWAEALIEQGRGSQALGSLTRALDQAEQAGRLPHAIELQRLRVRAVSGADPEPLVRLGELELQARQFEAALATLERAASTGHESPRLLMALGSALWENNQLQRAGEVLKRAVDAAENDALRAGLQYEYARFLLFAGRASEALPFLEELLGKSGSSEDPILVLHHAQAMQAAGKEQELVAAAFSRAVTALPEHSRARYGLARALQRAGRSEEAKEQLEIYRRLDQEDRALGQLEGSARAQANHAAKLLREGRAEDALVELAEAPQTVAVLRVEALALRALGRTEQAREAVRRALELVAGGDAGASADLRTLLRELER